MMIHLHLVNSVHHVEHVQDLKWIEPVHRGKETGLHYKRLLAYPWILTIT